MQKIVTMELLYESEEPGNTGDGDTPEADPATPGTGSGQEGLTPERLMKIIRKMESGFYDTPEVREQITRRVREELGP